VQLLASTRGQKLAEEDVESEIFHGMTFCKQLFPPTSVDGVRIKLKWSDIPRGNAKYTKADLEGMVHKHGGEFTQAQLSDLSAYVISLDDKSESTQSSSTFKVGRVVDGEHE
jgi:DNA ligase-4